MENIDETEKNGGETGIRTLETVPRLHAFQACAFDHSATSPTRQQKLPEHYLRFAKNTQIIWDEITLQSRALY